jgi:hypothetical protein
MYGITPYITTGFHTCRFEAPKCLFWGCLNRRYADADGGCMRGRLVRFLLKLIFDSWGWFAARKLLILLVWGADFSNM